MKYNDKIIPIIKYVINMKLQFNLKEFLAVYIVLQ